MTATLQQPGSTRDARVRRVPGYDQVHWALAHGLPRKFIERSARGGDLQSRMIVAGASDELFALIEEMRAHGGLYRAKLGFVATGHADVRAVLTSDDFKSGFPISQGLIGTVLKRVTPPWINPVEPPSLLMVEPPDHTRYRRLVMRVFTMRAVQRLTERTQEIADRLLDGLEATASSPVDIVERYCAQLPVTVIAEILGVPEAERGRVLAFGGGAAPSLDLGVGWRDYRSIQASLRDFDTWLGHHLAALRRNPGDNLLSQLVTAEEDGVRLNERELKATAGLVLAAGFETTVNLLSNGITLLSEHPDQLAALRADPSGWSNVSEEVLRFDPPVLLTGRMAKVDTEIAGRRIPAGAMVTAMLTAANRDPAIFERPGELDVARPNAAQHLSFSAGRHHCLGASLARMEGEVGLRTIFERYPDLKVTPGGRRRTTRILRGWESQPVQLRP